MGSVVTVDRVGPSGQKVLVSYVVAAPPGAEVDVEALRLLAAGRLPDYMVPSAIIVVDRIPLTPAGKLDRRALPEPDLASDTPYRAPRSIAEQTLAAVLADVLGVDRVGVDDDFFRLGGGDSIMSTQVVSRARARGVLVSARDVFERRTVAGLASVAHPVRDDTPSFSRTCRCRVRLRDSCRASRHGIPRPWMCGRWHRCKQVWSFTQCWRRNRPMCMRCRRCWVCPDRCMRTV